MTGGVLNPPVFLYSADYEALTENTYYITSWTEDSNGDLSPQNRGFGGQSGVRG